MSGDVSDSDERTADPSSSPHPLPPPPPTAAPTPRTRLPADEIATRNVPPPVVPPPPRTRPPANAVVTEVAISPDTSPIALPDRVTERLVPSDGDPWGDVRLPGEQLATRNVPPPPVPVAGMPTAEPEQEFVLPVLEPMGHATTTLLVGRALFAVAALLVGLAARRSTGVGGEERATAFWPVVISAGVFTLVGLGAMVFWTTMLAGNARRLRARTTSATAMGWSWLLPVAWVAISCLTYLRFQVDADFDPLPGVAAIGWAITLTVAYGRLQGVFRGLSRTPPILWYTAFPIDLLAFGLVWWRLTGWPSPVGPDRDTVDLTANIAFGAAAALTVSVLVFAWLAQRASNGVYERLGRLEALHRPDAAEPEWFRAGLAARQVAAPPIAARPLISTKRLSSVVAGLHVAWGVALMGFGVVVGLLAFEYSDSSVFLGDELVIDDGDTDRIVIAGTIVGLIYVAAIVGHGIWAVLSAINARRVTVHSPNPGTFAIAFAPTPLLLVGGLVIGERLGYWMVIAGLTVAFMALILVNQMLMALSGRIGGQLMGFSRWTLCLTLTYLVGVVLNVLFSQSTSQLGFYATLSLAQGALIAFGGVIGLSAMRALEATIQNHRRVRRSDET